MARRAAAPATLTAHHDCEFREVLDRVGDKWSLLVIAMLEQRPTARARFSELKRSIPGISQRMLTATLRSLERDGLLKSPFRAKAIADAVELCCPVAHTPSIDEMVCQLMGREQEPPRARKIALEIKQSIARAKDELEGVKR